MKDCRMIGCCQCKGNHHVRIHEERKQRADVLALIPDIRGCTFSGDCVMPLISFHVKGDEIRGNIGYRLKEKLDH